MFFFLQANASLLIVLLCVMNTSLCYPLPVAEAEPMTGVEMYMGTMMAAALLAKGVSECLLFAQLSLTISLLGYLFGALVHGLKTEPRSLGNYGSFGRLSWTRGNQDYEYFG